MVFLIRYISENKEVYRAEYLAYQLIQQLENKQPVSSTQFLALSEKEQLNIIQELI